MQPRLGPGGPTTSWAALLSWPRQHQRGRAGLQQQPRPLWERPHAELDARGLRQPVGRDAIDIGHDAAGTRQGRIYYSYESGPLLREREYISPTARAVTSRTTYGYASGVLSTIQRDGDTVDLPDGTPDSTRTYGFAGEVWSEVAGASTTTYTYDPGALTVTSSDAVFHLAAAIDEPSRFFATTRLDMPRISWSEHVEGGVTVTVTYVYSGDRLLEIHSSEVLGRSFRDEYLYACP